MRKVICWLIGLLLLCFLIPVFFTSQFGEKKETETVAKQSDTSTAEENSQYHYKDYDKIKLLHSKTGQIEEVQLDSYLYGVVSAEMPADYEIEALKAQAVVARTYTIYKIQNAKGKHGEADICDDFACCQAWILKEDRMNKWEESKREENWNKIVEAVNNTVGKVITYDGSPINAFFHSNSGGTTEVPINVWGGSAYPYLQVVQTAGEDTYKQYASEVSLTKEEVIQKIKQTHEDIVIDYNLPDQIKILEYTESGRVKTIQFGNVNLSGVEARTIFGLKSSNFTVQIEEEQVKFEVKGYGHGVGMSQTGADTLAKEGKTYEEIIKHFYKDVEIVDY